MQLGILTAPFPDMALEQVADYAADAGFEALEIACWPQAGGEKRRYAGTAHLPVEDMTPARGSEIMGMLKAKGLTVSGLGYYPNPLHADAAHREAVTGAPQEDHHRRRDDGRQASSTPSSAATGR
jgi:sugar phosphate isomerase/epimerase